MFVPRTYAAVFNCLDTIQLNLETAQMKFTKIQKLCYRAAGAFAIFGKEYKNHGDFGYYSGRRQ